MLLGEEGELGSGDDDDNADGAAEIRSPNSGLLDDAWPAELDNMVPIGELCVWVDPLDGTREFTSGNYEFVSTLVGISRGGRPIAGVE